MKKLLLAGLLLFPIGGVVCAQATSRNVAVLAYSADQLAAQFAGQNRKSVVAAINTVPAAEQVYAAADGKEYQVVRYGGAHQNYRMFLFDFKLPQTLIGVADSPRGILAFNERYQLNIPVTEQNLARNNGVFLTSVNDVANNTQYQVYQNNGEFLLFENGQLVRTFYDGQEYSAFMATITASNSAYAARQAQEQTALEQARLVQEQNRPTYVHRSYWGPVLGTALVGGLVWSTINWNRHHRPHYSYRPAPRPGPRPGSRFHRR